MFKFMRHAMRSGVAVLPPPVYRVSELTDPLTHATVESMPARAYYSLYTIVIPTFRNFDPAVYEAIGLHELGHILGKDGNQTKAMFGSNDAWMMNLLFPTPKDSELTLYTESAAWVWAVRKEPGLFLESPSARSIMRASLESYARALGLSSMGEKAEAIYMQDALFKRIMRMP